METLEPHKIEPKKFYSLKDVATFLNLSYVTVLKLKKQGLLSDTRKSGEKKIYISGQNILDYMNSSGKKAKKKKK